MIRWLYSSRWIGINKLILNMLNCFKDYKIYIHILYRILDLALPKSMSLTLKQQCMMFVLESQYHACWCAGDFRSQSIGRHGIDHITSPASEELIYCGSVTHFWMKYWLSYISAISYYLNQCLLVKCTVREQTSAKLKSNCKSLVEDNAVQTTSAKMTIVKFTGILVS